MTYCKAADKKCTECCDDCGGCLCCSPCDEGANADMCTTDTDCELCGGYVMHCNTHYCSEDDEHQPSEMDEWYSFDPEC